MVSCVQCSASFFLGATNGTFGKVSKAIHQISQYEDKKTPVSAHMMLFISFCFTSCIYLHKVAFCVSVCVCVTFFVRHTKIFQGEERGSLNLVGVLGVSRESLGCLEVACKVSGRCMEGLSMFVFAERSCPVIYIKKPKCLSVCLSVCPQVVKS